MKRAACSRSSPIAGKHRKTAGLPLRGKSAVLLCCSPVLDNKKSTLTGASFSQQEVTLDRIVSDTHRPRVTSLRSWALPSLVTSHSSDLTWSPIFWSFTSGIHRRFEVKTEVSSLCIFKIPPGTEYCNRKILQKTANKLCIAQKSLYIPLFDCIKIQAVLLLNIRGIQRLFFLSIGKVSY